jgi:hypothetical protein
MGNYPNMSYCAFENTFRALDQITTALIEARNEGRLEEFVNDLSMDERVAFEQIVHMAHDLIAVAETCDELA